VLKALGPPTKKLSADAPAGPEIWSYEAKDQWLHLLFGANKVVQIDFTSPSFKTEEGFCTDLKSVAENKTAFAPFTVHGHPDHQRYQLRKGGFSIYALGSLTSEDEIGGKRVASVYKGSRPVVEAFAVVHEPACGWRPVENSAGAPQPKYCTQKKLLTQYPPAMEQFCPYRPIQTERPSARIWIMTE
jgi:hypothetical protein